MILDYDTGKLFLISIGEKVKIDKEIETKLLSYIFRKTNIDIGEFKITRYNLESSNTKAYRGDYHLLMLYVENINNGMLSISHLFKTEDVLFALDMDIHLILNEMEQVYNGIGLTDYTNQIKEILMNRRLSEYLNNQ